MGPTDSRIRNRALALPVRDSHVLVQGFSGAEDESPSVGAIGGGTEFVADARMLTVTPNGEGAVVYPDGAHTHRDAGESWGPGA